MAKFKYEELVGVKARHDSGSYGDYSAPVCQVRKVKFEEDGTVEIETYVGGPHKGNVVSIELKPICLSALKTQSDFKIQLLLNKTMRESVLLLKREGLEIDEVAERLGAPWGSVYDIFTEATDS